MTANVQRGMVEPPGPRHQDREQRITWAKNGDIGLYNDKLVFNILLKSLCVEKDTQNR